MALIGRDVWKRLSAGDKGAGGGGDGKVGKSLKMLYSYIGVYS